MGAVGAAAAVLWSPFVAAGFVAEDASVIVVVGIGADGMAGLSENSRCELRNATVIYGSSRQLDLLDDTVTALRHPWPTPMLPALEALPVDDDIHVVASGDPSAFGLFKYYSTDGHSGHRSTYIKNDIVIFCRYKYTAGGG